MLEQRIEKLENTIEALSNDIGGLKTSIDALTQALTHNPPPQQPVAKVQDISEAKSTNKVKPQGPDLEDVRASLIQLTKSKGKEAAKNILADFDAIKVSDLNETDYHKVIDVAHKYKEAA